MRDEKSKKMNFMDISDAEKKQVKDRITNSIYAYIMRRRRIKLGISIATASIAVIISIGIFNNSMFKTSTLEELTNTLESDDIESLKNVKLLLGDNQNIEITDENTIITYSNSGEKINIGNSKSVYQESSKNKKIVYNTLIVPYGKRSEIELADGSKVWLNSGSKLVFPASFIGDKREVYLEGEGVFEVAHNKKQPFVVRAANHEIEVLGTVFNVSSYPEDSLIEVALKDGIVQINPTHKANLKSNKNIIIKPGELAICNKETGGIQTNQVDIEKYFSWREGIFIFKNDDLFTIMKKISKYYNVSIIIKNKDLANQEFSGLLDIKDSVESVLNTIKETTEFEYQIKEENKIIIN